MFLLMPAAFQGKSASASDGAAGGKIGKAGVAALNAVLDKLDAVDDSAFRNRRASSRCAFRKLDVPIRVHHPGGTTSVKSVATRNLSANGIGFLYTSFLHKDTRIEVLLQRRLGGEDLLQGKVVFCAHVGGVFHQVGVKFDQKIFPKLYLDPGTYDDGGGGGHDKAAAAPQELAGKVLYVDAQEMDRALLQHQLKGTGIELTTAASADLAVEALQAGAFDLVLADLNLTADATIEATLARFRAGGYAGPFCLVTAETSPSRLKAAQEAGVLGTLAKPYEQSKLLALLGSWLNGGGRGGPAVSSSLAGQSGTTEILGKYVAGVHEMARDLQNAFESDNLERLRQLAISIKGTGSGYGFVVLSDAARDAIKGLDATMSVAESAAQVQRLIDLCKRVTDKPAA